MNKIDTGIAELLAKQPSNGAEKDAYIAELQKTVQLLSDEVRNMDELLALLRKKQFGPSSEQTKPTEEQLGLFNEAEQENKPEPKEPIKKDARGYHILNALEKWKLCKGVQIENVDFDIPIDQRNCSNCGTQMKLLGKNMVREVPEFIPAKLKLNRYWQYTAPAMTVGRQSSCTITRPAAAETMPRLFWKDSTVISIPMAITNFLMSHAAAVGRICEESS